MKEIIHSPTKPGTSKQGRRAGWLLVLSHRLAACLQVKTLQKLSVPMNYLCKMLKWIIMFAKKIMDFFCALQSTQQMGMWRRKIVAAAAAALLTYWFPRKITKPSQQCRYFKRFAQLFHPSVPEQAPASAERSHTVAEEQNMSHFVRLKRLWSEVVETRVSALLISPTAKVQRRRPPAPQ